MAHALEIIDGEAQAFFGGNVPAWHGLGTVIPEDVVDTDRALVLAGLDWEVEQHPHVIIMPDGSRHEVPREYQNHRSTDGKFLGVVGQKYRVFQNRQAFAFGDSLVEDHGAKWHTAGALHDGTKAWMLMKLPQDVFIGGEPTEQVQPFICFMNTHDGSSSVKMFTTFTRVVCQNTLTWAMQGTGNMHTIRHTGNFSDPEAMERYVAQAQEKLGVVFDLLARMEREGAAMMRPRAARFTTDDFVTMLDVLNPPRSDYKSAKAEATAESIRAKKIDLLVEYFQHSPNLENVRDTQWAALQAVIEVNDHRHAERDFGVRSSGDKRMERIIGGGGMVQATYDYLMAA